MASLTEQDDAQIDSILETLESAAATDPNVAAALDELYSGTAFP